MGFTQSDIDNAKMEKDILETKERLNRATEMVNKWPEWKREVKLTRYSQFV